MCIGREERGRRGFAGSEIPRGAASRGGAAGVATCELCGSRASLYCRADDAFLCRKCDERVHGANFLARRHLRCFVCGACRTLTQRFVVGASLEVDVPTLLSWKDIRLSKRKPNIRKK